MTNSVESEKADVDAKHDESLLIICEITFSRKEQKRSFYINGKLRVMSNAEKKVARMKDT
jgi:hypothetical protein